MKKLFKHIIFFVAIISTLSLGSCLNGDDNTTVVTHSDCAITSFYISSYKVTNGSTTTSYTSTVTFDVDQYNKTIENKDSLPYGTDPKVLCYISTKNSGYPYLKNVADEDAIYFTSGDTIDFTNGDRYMYVVSTDGAYNIKYKLRLNIHKESKNIVSGFDAPVLVSDLQGKEKEFADSVLNPVTESNCVVLGMSCGNKYGVKLDTHAIWNLTTNTEDEVMDGVSLPYSNISLCEVNRTSTKASVIVAKDQEGNVEVLYKSESSEGQKWMALKNIADLDLPSNTDCYAITYGDYLLAFANNTFYLSEDCGLTWKERYFMTTPSSLKNIEPIAMAKDENNIIWIFTKDGYVYRGKQNGIAWK